MVGARGQSLEPAVIVDAQATTLHPQPAMLFPRRATAVVVTPVGYDQYVSLPVARHDELGGFALVTAHVAP
jgi:hypothetical protein